jgi:hypothetical protein
MFSKILARLREPSTYAGFAALSVLLGITQDQSQALATLIAAVAGLVAVFMPEKK